MFYKKKIILPYLLGKLGPLFNFLLVFTVMYKFLQNSFEFSQTMDGYTQSMHMYLFEFYVIILLYASLFSFLPWFQTETANFVLLFMMNVMVMGTTLFISFMNVYRMLMENVHSNTGIMFLIFFIILEIVTHLMRLFSITLSMSANATSGHMLMLIILGLIRMNSFLMQDASSFIVFVILFLSSLVFLSLELIVSLIQMYVIMLLLIYYSLELE